MMTTTKTIVHTLSFPLLLMNLHQDENAFVNFYIRMIGKDYDLSQISNKTRKKFDQFCLTHNNEQSFLENTEDCKINFKNN